jgi:hypothetical protein
MFVQDSLLGVPHIRDLTISPSPFRLSNHVCSANSTPEQKAMREHLAHVGLGRRTHDTDILIRGLIMPFKPGGDWAALSGKGHECLSLMMPYDSYRPVGYSETKPGYDIMRGNCTSMKYLSGDIQVLIP